MSGKKMCDFLRFMSAKSNGNGEMSTFSAQNLLSFRFSIVLQNNPICNGRNTVDETQIVFVFKMLRTHSLRSDVNDKVKHLFCSLELLKGERRYETITVIVLIALKYRLALLNTFYYFQRILNEIFFGQCYKHYIKSNTRSYVINYHR